MSKSYTFFSKPFKIIIQKMVNLYIFSIINEDTNEFFQSEEAELKSISLQTLSAAFNNEVKNITNQIIYENQNQIKIIVKVSLDFFPQFCQEIHLHKIQKCEQQVQKINYLELQSQMKILQKQLQWLVATYKNKKTMTFYKQFININEIENIIWEIDVQRGDYLVQCYGYCAGAYDNQYEFGNGYYGSIQIFQSKSNFLFEVHLNKTCIFTTNSKPFDYQNYEYPYLFNFIIHVQQKSQLSVNVKDVKKLNGIFNNNKLVFQKIKMQKQ